MTVSDSQKRATNKYLKANYIQINVKVRKEKGLLYREYFNMHSEIQINKCIESYLDNLIMNDPILSSKLSELNSKE